MKARVNAVEIAYDLTGGGPVVLLAHALSANSRMWDEQVQALAKHFTVVRFDTRGHGASETPDGPYTMATLAEDARALMDYLRIDRAHWVGLSLGGAVAQTFALAYPERTLSLTIVDATCAYPAASHAMWLERIDIVQRYGMKGIADGTLERWFTPSFGRHNPTRLAQVREMILGMLPAGYAGCVQAMMGFDVSQQLERIRCPALIMCGALDQALPPTHSESIHAKIQGSKLRLIPEAAHLSNIERSALYNDWQLEFLKSRPSG